VSAGRPKTFVWRDVARSAGPRPSKTLARHGTARRYEKHGCRCDECLRAHRNAVNAYRKGVRDRDLIAKGALELIPRVEITAADRRIITLCGDHAVLWWRIERWARLHGVTKGQAMDIIVNRILDKAAAS